MWVHAIYVMKVYATVVWKKELNKQMEKQTNNSEILAQFSKVLITLGSTSVFSYAGTAGNLTWLLISKNCNRLKTLTTRISTQFRHNSKH